jgi:uncharacterized protein
MDKHLPGKFVWFELVTADAKKAQRFYAEVLGWRTEAFEAGADSYDMIWAGERMIGGYDQPKRGQTPHWISYVSVENVDAAARAARENGGKIVIEPFDMPDIGRAARIADPQGAELSLFKSAKGDPADSMAPHGVFLWNELHTPAPREALVFYERVLRFSHRTLNMGHAGEYHILSKNGVDRGGVTHHLAKGATAHWLPYVAVDDADAALALARENGASVLMGPEDIPNAGRCGVVRDPTGAVLAMMKPVPM